MTLCASTPDHPKLGQGKIMKPAYCSLILFLLALLISGGNSEAKSGSENRKANVADSKREMAQELDVPLQCPPGSIATGKNYNPVPDGSYPLRALPSNEADKIPNDAVKGMNVPDRFKFCNIDDSALVHEECTYKDWSWVRVVEPIHLAKSHRGWVESKYLMKDIPTKDAPYQGKIASLALDPYTKDQYPRLFSKFQSRLPEIEAMRRNAAEMALDSGGCDRVIESELSSTSSVSLITINVLCKNGARMSFNEDSMTKRNRAVD